jgi:hypothetical protein
MRRITLAVTLIPFALTAQVASSAPAALQEWQRAHAEALAKYDADHAKSRAKRGKSLTELQKRIDAFLVAIRDEFGHGSSYNSDLELREKYAFDPDSVDRQRRRRLEHLRMDDSSVAEHIAARRTGDPAIALASLYTRRRYITEVLVEVDSLQAQLRFLLGQAQRVQDLYKSEDNESLPPATREFVKKGVDVFGKLLRAERARAEYHREQAEALRTELTAIDAQVAAANAALGRSGSAPARDAGLEPARRYPNRERTYPATIEPTTAPPSESTIR